MGKRKKVSLEEKASLVEPLGLATDAGSSASGRSRVLYHGELDQLVSLGGISALEENGNQPMRRYSEEVKRKAVEEYLSGQGSSIAIVEKY